MWNNPLLLNLFYVFAIGVNIVLLRYFSTQLDTLNNNGLRFLSGAVVLFAWVWWKYRSALLNLLKTPKLLAIALLVGVLMCANMFFYLEGASRTNAITAAIFGVISMPFGVLIAGLFFEDERQKMRSKTFWIGCFLTLFGCLGFIWQGKSVELGDSFLAGSLFLLLSITIRNVQNLVVKFTNNKINVFTLSSFTALSTAFISLFASYHTDNIQALHHLSPLFLISLLLVGVYGITAGMILAFHIIQKQGIITYQILELLLPLSTALIAYLFLGETVSLMQMLFAVVVIFGASVALGLLKIKRKDS
ncbi:multidrug transporter [Pasteurellaceae bacterium Orientalotternb1]|nr:multidrug transporter [Pasteurellaceae bacterium Orientalotternb1]